MARKLWQTLNGSLRTRTGAMVALLVLLAIAGLTWHFATPGNGPLEHRFVVGQRLTYRLEYLSASAANLDVLTGDADAEAKNDQAVFTNVEGNLEATVLEANGDGALVAFVLRDPEVQVVFNGELAMVQAEAIQADLSRTLLAVVDRQGKIRSVHLDANVNSLSHTFVRALLAATQVVLPSEPAQSAWQTREGDPNGEFAARYKFDTSVTSEPSIVTFSKERMEYLQRPRQHSIRRLDVESIAKPGGNLTVRFDLVNGRVESVAGTEATTIFVDGKVVARAETTMRMQFKAIETISKGELEKVARVSKSLRAEQAIALSAPAPTAGREASIHRSELGDATVDGLLAELAQLDAKADPEASDTALYLKLKALVYLHPEACPRLAKELSAAKLESKTMVLITDALASIGHAQAQIALQTAIVARAPDEPALAMLVAALAMVEMPTEASESTLRELAATSSFASIRANAELGLGTMAHQLATAQPERTARIARAMAAKLAETKSNETRRHYLFVLGNAGANETLEIIARHLSDTDADVRAAAAAALRWIELSEAERLLCIALTTDADQVVRVEAATSLGFRVMTPTSFAAQKSAFLKDASTSVRLATLVNLARAGSAYPEGRTLLTQAVNDPVPEVREEAANLLANE
jgi:hypothetical protein